MATETTVHVARARYGGFVATFSVDGERSRVFFENSLDLAAELADQCIDAETIEHVIDAFEQIEWDESTYPLFMPTEAVCDSPIDEPAYGDVSAYVEKPSPLWNVAATSLLMGAAAAPWVFLVIGFRWWMGV